MSDSGLSNILMFCPQFCPLIGGYERAAERLSIELVKLGLSVDVVAERRHKQWAKKQDLHGTNVLRLWCIYRPGWHVVSSLVSLVFFLLVHGRRYQIYHVHQYGLYAAIASLMAMLWRKRIVIKLTSTGEQGIKKELNKYPGVMRWAIVRLHRRIDACIVTSHAAYEEAIRFGFPESRVIAIGNGVDTDLFNSAGEDKALFKAMHGLQAEKIVLYVGRLSHEKNPFGLLQCWNDIQTEVPETLLVYVGGGPEEERMRQYISQHSLEDRVYMVGMRSDVDTWLKSADVYVLPSFREGLSNTLLEAMSTGLPVVSTKVSGSIDLFAKADLGEIVEIGSSEQLSDAIKKLLKSRQRRELCGVNARNLIEQSYSSAVIAKRTVDLYRSLLLADR